MRLRHLLVVASVLALAGQGFAQGCERWNTSTFFLSATLAEVRACLEAGARVNARDGVGFTPLHWAAQWTGNPDVIWALIAAGADVDARNEYGYTPLHWAAWSSNSPAAALALLAAGADVNAQDGDGWTPLHWAVAPPFGQGSITFVWTLLVADAWVNFRGFSPLHHAAQRTDNPAVIVVLLEAGADASARDSEGKTAWDYAQGNEALRGTDAWWRLREGRF